MPATTMHPPASSACYRTDENLVKAPFEIEWMGGPAEHHFRKARPTTETLPWGTLDPSKYSPEAVASARASWTEVAINEYRAVASFTEVLRALVDTKAPLDLIGMTSDFLADEVSHVELASRMAMELGGAVDRLVDMDRFAMRPRGLDAFQRANELVLRVSCIAEAFAGGTATVSYGRTSHELPRAVYETILRDEAHHRRMGGIYLEWALEKMDEKEIARLGNVLFDAVRGLAPFWQPKNKARREPSATMLEELQALGWLPRATFAEVAREVVLRDIIEPLATIGITVSKEEHTLLFG
jgi:hypothetical protein